METAISTVAQVFVGPLIGTIYDRYVPAILEKIGIQWDVTEEMEKLSDILLTIQGVLEDAEDKQTTSKPIRNWLTKLKDVAYDVEDILDVCATEALHNPESTGIINGADMVEKITQLIDKFDKITEQRSKFNLINLTSTTRVVHCRVNPGRETSSFPKELKLYGRDEEKQYIVDLMVNNSIAENLSIYAIVGIGGLGKTTLAQMVYNDNTVEDHFEIRRWVCVSENFEVKSLIGDIIESGSNNAQSLDQLQRCLQNILSGKRFLIVLDDVWNEDAAKWERLKSSLTCGAQGSSIIVTTRSDKVASLMRSSQPHVCRPKFLSEEDCFSLFKHRAFGEGEEEHHPNLVSIGKEIVKKCGGVPLAAKALGGLLRFKREKAEWSSVQESGLWKLPQDGEDSILPALLLSYKHLPQHLRQCFVYCSIFPKDYNMKKKVLIQLWMANGFLQPEGNMELEDIGNGIFNDLVWRGFFQEVTFDNCDGMRCKMHDLVHDLACSITRNECFSVVTDADRELFVGRPNTMLTNTTRHLAIDLHMLFSTFDRLSMVQFFLRTLLQLGKARSDISALRLNFSDLIEYLRYGISAPRLNFSNLIYLRVLDLSHLRGLKTLPESIARLKLLRYLDLSGTSIALLSDEVFGNLINLQTLKLRECDNLKMLPGNMRKLTNLRHLDISGAYNLLGMPVGMGQLKCLHMLSNFIVSEDCGIGELQELDHLRGRLKITGIGNQIDLDDSQNAILIRKQGIRYLELNWSLNNSCTNDKLIADALQPHPNIECLKFHYYGGSDFPRWMNSTCLPSLVEITLGDCSKCKHLPTLGLLPHLKKLSVERIPQVECIGNEFYYCDEEKEGNNMMKARGGMVVLFPALEELELFEMHSLEEWKGRSSSSSPSPSPSPLPLPSSSRMKEAQVSIFPVIKNLGICKCPMLVNLPEEMQNLTSLKSLTIISCDGLKSLNKCLQHLTNLHELSISDCGELELLLDDFQNLVSLQDLCLEGLPKLAAVPVVGSSTLNGCDGLKSLNNRLQLLTNLHRLTISYCPELELLLDDFQNLVSLQYLCLQGLPKLGAVPVVGSSTLDGCDGLKSLNNCLQLLTNLHELEIVRCDALELLPGDFQNLVSLRSLHLEALPKLAAVPVLTNQRSLWLLVLYDCKNLKSLPEGLQHLTALRDLRIEDCHPELYRRCEQDTGEDWHKIAHIPKRSIYRPRG